MTIRNQNTAQDENPGPTTYQEEGSHFYKHGQSSIGTKFGRENRDKDGLVTNDNPGPGRYSQKTEIDFNIQHNKGKTIASKLPDISDQRMSLAPGHYNPNQEPVKPSIPSYKFGSETRQEIKKSDNPDPTAYNPSQTFTQMNTPAWGMGSQARPGLTKANHNPGPDAYDVNHKSSSNFSTFFIFFRVGAY